VDDANELHINSYRRDLRARNRAAKTIEDYLKRITYLADHHDGADVMELDKEQLSEYFIALLERQEATSVGVHFRTLRALYNWAAKEGIIERSPMAGMEEPKVTDRPPPIVPDDAIVALLKACSGTDFESRRDLAVIRVWCEPGSPRVSEMSRLDVGDADMRQDQVTIHGKGDRVRTIPFGARTGQALDRYLRMRSKHSKAKDAALWIGVKGRLTPSGLTQMVRRRCRQAGIDPMHPHLFRHKAADDWFDSGGSEQDAEQLFGWSKGSPMSRIYGRSASAQRARRAARRASRADRF
jgi:site-specific recombinase XerD